MIQYAIYQLTYVVGYNKRMVKSEDVPRTYEDLLKPIWKGKKISNDTENFVWFDALLKPQLGSQTTIVVTS
jgi:ABC-type Fe3+ transport system substrate-binding protein